MRFPPEPGTAARAVWITRAEPGAGTTAIRVAQLGFEPIVAPLLTFRPVKAALSMRPGEALAFTSINGVARTAALTSRRDMRVFAVGDSTAKAASTAGFCDVVSAGGDVESLAIMIAEARPAAVLHPAAQETAGDLVGLLKAAGVQARKTAVYETLAATVLPAAVASALKQGRLAAALFHSPKAARTAATIMEQPADALATTTAYGLSEGCVDPLRLIGFKDLVTAPAPSEDALMQILATLSPSGPP